MPDSTAIHQLCRHLVRILNRRETTMLAHIAQGLAEFWVADACWLWSAAGQAVVHSIRPSRQLPTISTPDQTVQELELSGWQVLSTITPQGSVVLAREHAWTPIESEDLLEIANVVMVAFIQVDLQQQVDISQQSMRQIQALADERTSQLQSSQNLLSKLQDANRRRIKQLDASNRLKDEFISTISHELRTPLTSMSLAIRMLRQPQIDEARRTKYLEILEKQCTQEVELINDLLTLQQLESKQLNVDRQSVILVELIQPLIDQFQATWGGKPLDIIADLPATAAPAWETEPASVKRIVQELLTNAGKFAQPQTTVHLQVTYGQQVQITVTNEGRWISPEEQVDIFGKFRRGAGVTHQAIAGTGLGLALVKSLVEHLQGKITVRSQLLADANLANTDLALTCFEVLLPWEES